MRVGTDCSGIEGPIQALRNLGIEHRHVFSSETNKFCIQSIKANYNPEVLYGDSESSTPNGDITCRDHANTPQCDLYVAGFPCQPFSLPGSRKGLHDTRGTVFESCLDYIRTQRPKFFVLENVKNLLYIENGSVFKHILSEIKSVPDYAVSYAVLNTKDYGIPQSRNRLYIVGMRGTDRPFVFPSPILCQPPESFVDWNDKTPSTGPRAKACEAIGKILQERNLPGVFFDQLHMQYSKKDPICKQGYPYVPCITCNSYTWCSPMKRRASHKELLRLQGFPEDFVITVSDTNIRRQIGNAMSVNVLEALFTELLLQI